MYDTKANSHDDIKYKMKARDRYLNAIRVNIKGSASIFMKRSTKEISINNYSKQLLPILKSNHDIQLVIVKFGCANYMTGYLTKSEAGFSKTLKVIEETCKDLPNMDIVKEFGKSIDKKREVSIQEIYYRLLGLPMTKFSCKVKFINTCHPKYRDGLVKGNWEELGDNESPFHMSCHQYYEQRPVNDDDDPVDWDNMTLAEFMSYYEYSKRCPNSESAEPLLDNSGYIYERKRPAVLRYFLNFDDPEDFARGLLILFYPFRNEMDDIHALDVYELLNDNKQQIEEKDTVIFKIRPTFPAFQHEEYCPSQPCHSCFPITECEPNSVERVGVYDLVNFLYPNIR